SASKLGTLICLQRCVPAPEASLSRRLPMTQPTSAKFNPKVENPAAHFEKPKDVVQDEALSEDEKKKALNTWEQDARQLLTASNEGMPGREEGIQPDDHHRLGEVARAKDSIGQKPKHKQSH